MIPCTEFIPAYSELFKFLEAKGGRPAVLDFWNYLSDNFLGNLEELIKQHGLRGCWMYWSRALNEEAADFTMELNEDETEFRITMHHCPSKGLLLKTKHITPYHDYCGHCDVLYRRIFDRLGYEHPVDRSQCDKARCSSVTRRKKSS